MNLARNRKMESMKLREPQATRRPRLGKSSIASGTRGAVRSWYAVERSRLPAKPGAGKRDSLKALRYSHVAVFFLLGTALSADVPPEQKPEVEHLIAFLETSDCSMVRNGASHDGADAARHVRRKYQYFRDDIGSTEEFIELSATKSTMSRKAYEVHCPGQPPRKSADWLMDELKAYRAESP